MVDGSAPVRLRLMVYDKDHVEERQDIPLIDAIAAAKGPGVGWITLYDASDEDYQLLETELDLHPLALEDTRNQRQRPKIEQYAANSYLVARTLRRPLPDETGHDGEPERAAPVLSEQSNIFLGNGWVVVIHERPIGIFDEVRERIRRGRPRIRNSGADYLAYGLLDAIVDGYLPVLAQLGDEIEELEERIHETPSKQDMNRVQGIRRDLRLIRRTVWPMRDTLAGLLREESHGFKRTTVPFLRDVHDHTVQALDTIDAFKEASAALVEIYLNLVSNRTNEVMKVLTIVATIFIPLTFIAGVYGMNFDAMPELRWRYGYPAVWAFMLVVIGIELWYFRSRGWI